jgi:hypothetical protein
MDERKRRAIIWEQIEHLAFHPSDQKKWLNVYCRSLGPFWSVQESDVVIKDPLKGFEAFFLNLVCEYKVETQNEYKVRIRNVTGAPKCYCSLHVDPMFCSKASFVGTQPNYRIEEDKKYIQEDVAAVLDGMIFHPRAHCHVEDLELKIDLGPGAAPIHQTRIGGGIENAFVFLTHLRFQFCLIAPQAREDEKTRLVNLFTNKIKNRERREIPAAVVLNLLR